jgi:hypothetical protein
MKPWELEEEVYGESSGVQWWYVVLREAWALEAEYRQLEDAGNRKPGYETGHTQGGPAWKSLSI